MAQDNQPDLQVEGWLKTVGIESLCQWDVLVFLYRHQSSLVRRESSGIHLTGEDDGRGFDNDALLRAPGTGKGLGLLDIRKRAALLNGSVTLESRPGSGTTVHVCIPLREESHG
jgi:signal transduction histidine kinase